ncbi:MAG: beta-galactosidase [Verrucomicrobiae bacterium]|nr:beta-galactosidase [Verrucomicrobiae bacterium]
MTTPRCSALFCAALVAVASLPAGAAAVPTLAPQVLFDFARPFNASLVLTTDAQTTPQTGRALGVETGVKHPYPGITLKAPQERWDLRRYRTVEVEVKNAGTQAVTLNCRVDNPGADGRQNCANGSLRLEPGAAGVLAVPLSTTPWRLSEPLPLIGMRGAPGQEERLDPANVTQILLFVANPKTPHRFEVTQIRATGGVTVLDAKKFIPFIDEFGQFIHADWPGKIHSAAELAQRARAEADELAKLPGPPQWNRYGGYAGGPQLKATGFFRVEKYQGKWWLVDPEGRLFWSHGMDCVTPSSNTPITDREHYFRLLPPPDSPAGRFYGWGGNAPHGYYKDKPRFRTYDFAQANLLLKYGDNWPQAHAEISHRRLRSWGMNTIANWSDAAIYELRRTPYTANLSFRSKPLEGSSGYWSKFPDVFDPEFAQGIRSAMERQRGRAAGDPWCIGFFVHNELSWGDDTSLAVAALQSPPEQAAKRVLLEDLQARYGTIEKLNAAWEARYTSWDDLRQSTNRPNLKAAGADLRAFYTRFAETYFRVIREAVKEVAPNQLYLGCRFAWVNDAAATAAAKYCDVVSYNRYDYSVANHRLPNQLDRPTIIGEFHFGALDRGMFHTGLKPTASQEDRARKYAEYVRGALRNPQIVGTHWFQYRDQATTGRFDGENYQIGFVDICDTPYPETIRACREVGYDLYRIRLAE